MSQLDAVSVNRARRGGLRCRQCYPEEGLFVEEHLKHMMQELGHAINESLSESERIAAAIAEIKRAGYEVFLVLEATIGFNKCDEEGEEPAVEDTPRVISREFAAAGKVKWTSHDQKFLRALKIAVDEDPQS
jgi:hypothetical protein